MNYVKKYVFFCSFIVQCYEDVYYTDACVYVAILICKLASLAKYA